MTLYLPGIEKEAVALIDGHESVATATMVVLPSDAIATEAEARGVSDAKLAYSNALKHVKDSITKMFAPFDEAEIAMRKKHRPLIDALEKGVKDANALLLQWDEAKREAERKAREEAMAAEHAAAVAAAAAAASPDAEVDEMAADVTAAPVQVYVPPVEKRTRGADSTSTVTRTLRCEMVDVREVAKEWPHLLKLTTVTDAKREGEVLQRRGTTIPEGDERQGGVVLHGIRFWIERGIQTRRA